MIVEKRLLYTAEPNITRTEGWAVKSTDVLVLALKKTLTRESINISTPGQEILTVEHYFQVKKLRMKHFIYEKWSFIHKTSTEVENLEFITVIRKIDLSEVEYDRSCSTLLEVWSMRIHCTKKFPNHSQIKLSRNYRGVGMKSMQVNILCGGTSSSKGGTWQY